MIDDLELIFPEFIYHLHVIRHLNGKRKKGIECRRLSKIVRAAIRRHALRYFQRRIHSFEFATIIFFSMDFLARNAPSTKQNNSEWMKTFLEFDFKHFSWN